MGRSKQQTPQKRRLEEEEEEQQALQTLLRAPVEEVERAAAQATREAVQLWPTVALSPIEGLGTSLTVPAIHFAALQSLHETIRRLAGENGSSWSGASASSDPRQRAFGILPGTLGSQPSVRTQLDISTPWKNSKKDQHEQEQERKSNQQATAVLAPRDMPPGAKPAIDWLCETMAPCIGNQNIRSYLSYQNLIAAHPNLHNGRELLPIHVDHPLKDGFGVVIVTLAIRGNATILFQDSTDRHKCQMTLAPSQAYLLSEAVRNKYAHGVLADDPQRESLNLRFGLHDWEPTKEEGLVKIPSTDVLKYWELGQEQEPGAEEPLSLEGIDKEEDEPKKKAAK